MVVWMAVDTRRLGVLRTVNVNWNDDGWNVNANAVTNPNEWNDDNQVFSRNCRITSRYLAGGLLCMPFAQPPSSLPTSSNFSESRMYF